MKLAREEIFLFREVETGAGELHTAMGVSIEKKAGNENVYKIDTHMSVCMKLRRNAVKSRSARIEL